MKLLIVIDAPDDVLEYYKDIKVDYDLRGTPIDNPIVNESILYVEDAELQFLPERDEEPEDDMEDYIHADYDRMASYYYGLINGRNNVINEILGEYDAVD